MKAFANRQKGMVLITCLVILVLLTVLGVTALHLGFGNMHVVSNMQHMAEDRAAAQDTIEKVLSTENFTSTNLKGYFVDSSGNYTKTRTVDVNGDGVADIKVTVQSASCLASRPTTSLNLSNADDQACAAQQTSKSFGVVSGGSSTAASGSATCADTLWEISAQAQEINNPNATVTVAEGVNIRVQADQVQASCN